MHMDLINAVMVKMKPGFFSIFCKSYNMNMLVKYMMNLKEEIPQDLIRVCELEKCSHEGHSTIKDVSQGDVLQLEVPAFKAT